MSASSTLPNEAAPGERSAGGGETGQWEQILDLKQLLDGLPGMAYRCKNSPDWPLQFVSDGSMHISGYSPRSLLEGNPVWGSLIHPDDRDRVWESVQAAVRSGQAYEVEYRIFARDQSCRWLWERGARVETGGSDVLLEGFIVDITTLREREIELKCQQEHLRATIQYSPTGIVTLDKGLCILEANPAFCRLTGWESHDVIGHRFPEFVYPDDRKKAEVAVESCFRGGPGHCNIRHLYLHKNGHAVHAALSIAVGYNKGKRDFAVATIQDLTAQLETEARLKEQQERLARYERLTMLGDMTTGIAHELNQPLTAISTYAQACVRVLDSENPNYGRLKEALKKLSEQAFRAGDVVERVREFARQRHSKYELVDCNAVVGNVKGMEQRDSRLRGVVIHTRIAPDLPEVRCDSAQIEQLVLSLLQNAAESMRKADFRNGNVVEIATEMTSSGDVRISVIDSGSGVSDQVAPDLFRPFLSDKENGYGMSLSIGRSIITACGGRIDYVNNPSGGATFFLTLPNARGS